MNDLTHTTFGGGAPATMSSREIAELLEARHDSVKRTIERLADKEIIGLPPLVEYPDSLGRPAKEYVFSGEKGKRDSYVVVAQLSPEFTARLVDRWQELEAGAIRALLPQDYPSALRALADETERSAALSAKVQADAPKVAFAEQVEVAPDAISLGQAAKIFDTGRNRLCSKLREIKWLTRTNEPYQDKINAGLLDVKIGSWEHPEKGLQRSVTALVTGKGLAKLHQLIGGQHGNA